MPVYDAGGGGGRSISLTENTSGILDKPYDISGQFTPDMADKINEMFQQLYKATRLNKDSITSITITSGDLLVATRAITEAELEAMDTTAVTVVKGVSNRIIFPVFAVYEKNVTSAYGFSAAFRTRYTGVTTDIFTLTSGQTDLTLARTSITYRAIDTVNIANYGSTQELVGVAVESSLSADPGAGAGTIKVTIAYYLRIPTYDA